MNLNGLIEKGGDFTLEMYLKRARVVHRWRGKRFVVRNPWQHVAYVGDASGTKTYVNGLEVARGSRKEPQMCLESAVGKVAAQALVDELRLSKIVRPEYLT